MAFVFEPVMADFRKIDDEIPGGVDPFLSERLPWAAVHGDLARVQECMVGGANIDERGRQRRTALMEASAYGRVDVVEYLLNQNPQYNSKDSDGHTALMHGAKNGHLAVCEVLVNSKCVDLNMQDAKRWTALMWAAHNGHTPVVQYLVNASANSAVQDVQGRTAVDLATAKGSKAILEGTRAKRVREVTLEGARKGFANVIEKAVRRGATEEDLSLALLAASSSGHDGIVVQLLAAKASINFQITAKGGSAAEPGTPREGQQSGSALLLASANGHIRVVNQLLSSTADVNLLADDGGTLNPDRGLSPLWVAAKNGYENVVKACITAHADLEVRNWDGTTPLIIATKEGHDEVVRALLEVGANVFAKDMFGRAAGDVALQALPPGASPDDRDPRFVCAELLVPKQTEPPATETLAFYPRPQSEHRRSLDGQGPSIANLERLFDSVVHDIKEAGKAPYPKTSSDSF
jgi:ankyrin repeat protein